MLGDRAFGAAAPSLYNSLCSELRSITCVNSLKLVLRAIFFDIHILNRDFIILLNIHQLVLTILYVVYCILFNLLGLAIS